MCPRDPRLQLRKKQFLIYLQGLTMAVPPGSSAEAAEKCPHLLDGSSLQTGEASGCHLHVLPLAHSRSLVCLWKEPVHICSGFCDCCPGSTLLDHLALAASGACVCGSHRTVANTPFSTSYPPRAYCRGSRQKPPFPSLSLKEVYLHTLQAAA